MYKNSSKHDFYTSDSPVCGYIHENISQSAYEMFMPLTPGLAVSTFNRSSFNKGVTVDGSPLLDGGICYIKKTENMSFYNSLIISQSYRFVYNRINDFKLVKSVLKSNPGLAELNRQRFAID